MTFPSRLLLVLALLVVVPAVHADPPTASFIFPAGGRRGTPVNVRVGGLDLHRSCTFEMLGPGITATPRLERTKTIWFEGPLLPLPDSQQAEDYPKDMAGQVRIAADAPLGIRYWRLATSQGATPAMRFVVGDLPEVVEQETDGDPVPVEVTLPVTINGRIFPREDVDVWTFAARKGQTVRCEVCAARLGSPLDSYLEVLDPQGRRIAENDDTYGADSSLRFTAPSDGRYQVRIRDANFRGGPAYVYRLTLSAETHVERVYPLGGRRGGTVRLELTGQNLARDAVTLALPRDAPREYSAPLAVGDSLVQPFLLDVDDLPEYCEIEPNDEPAHAQRVTIPAVLNGRIDRPGDVDYWSFTAVKNQPFELEVRAARLGSPLEAELTVLDGSGKEVLRADSPGDPVTHFTPPVDGTYLVRIADRFRSRGGRAFAYRLRIAAPPAPDFRLHLSTDAVTLPRGGQAKLKLAAERVGGFSGPVALSFEGLPPTVSAAGAIPGAQTATEVVFKADAKALIRMTHFSIRGTALIDGKNRVHTATLAVPRGDPELDSVLLAVALPTPFKIVGDYDMRWAARGTVHLRHYRIDRHGFDGSLEVSVADHQARHLQGVTGPTITVPAGATEFDYPVTLPPWMEMGRTSRTCVMAVGVVKDFDGTEHEVSFTSTAQNEQIIAVIEPDRLGVEVEKPTLIVGPDQTVTLPVRVVRGKGLVGPARVELAVPPHLHGITCEPVVLAANEQEATLTIHFAGSSARRVNMPLTVRATVMDKNEPVRGEAKLEVRGVR